jgi:hypothetical protein
MVAAQVLIEQRNVRMAASMSTLLAVARELRQDLEIPYLSVAALVMNGRSQESLAIYDVGVASGLLLEFLGLRIEISLEMAARVFW